MINNDNLQILAQFIAALSEACQKLEKSYINKDKETFEESKRVIIELKYKINQILQ